MFQQVEKCFCRIKNIFQPNGHLGRISGILEAFSGLFAGREPGGVGRDAWAGGNGGDVGRGAVETLRATSLPFHFL